MGGYGFPISDEGSGADLGLQAVRLALRAHDGRIPATALLTEVMQRFGNSPTETAKEIAARFQSRSTSSGWMKTPGAERTPAEIRIASTETPTTTQP